MAGEKKGLSFHVGQVLRIISKNSGSFDDFCQINIKWIGPQVKNSIYAIGQGGDEQERDLNLYMLSSSIYRFVMEYNLSVKNDLSRELQAFLSIVKMKIEDFPENERVQIEYARQEMPISILKELINSEEMGNLRNLPEIAQNIQTKVDGWNASLEAKEQTAVRLGNVLEKHTREFNFVGLHEGFSDLEKRISSELSEARKCLWLFGALMIAPSFAEVLLIVSGYIDLTGLNTYSLVAVMLGTVTVTLLLLYFFRISLRKADSCTAQLMQIRLRMSLCRFIQGYADYSVEIKQKNSDALAKFESLIFSGIVGSDDKLPSTFDGMEQLAALAKSIKG